jgi:hypothetical protein
MDQVLVDLRTTDDPELGSLVALQGRPTQKVIDWAIGLCRATDPDHRIVGLRVLRELGHPLIDFDPTWDTIEPLVVELARDDQATEVVTWAISCLGYRSRSPAAFDAVMKHYANPNPDVRHSAASALPSFGEQPDRRSAIIDTLTAMAEDEDAGVRAYALMGLVYDLGYVEEIRPLLEAHLSDSDDQIRVLARKVLDGEWT